MEGLQVIRLLIVDLYLNGNTDILFNLKLSLLCVQLGIHATDTDAGCLNVVPNVTY